MANPYTSVSISNYNANPPSDDGSETSANQVLWSTIKTKLPDPLKTAIESINTNVDSAFDKTPFSGVTSISTTYTVLASDRGKVISASGTFTVTLLAAATATGGFNFAIVNNGTGIVTVDGDGSETINGSTTISLGPGESVFIVTDGSNWFGPVFTLSRAISAAGDISPSQITSDQNDYNPTGLSTASVIRIDTDASRSITGLAGGSDGRVIIIHYIGSNSVTLSDENASSTAANRFALHRDITLSVDQSCVLWYDSTSSRWRQVGSNLTLATQAEMEAAASNAVAVTPGTFQYHPGAVKAHALFNGSGTPAVTAGHNVASITDNATGNFAVNFTTGFSSASYTAVANVIATIGGLNHANIAGTATGSVNVITQNNAGSGVDATAIHVACMGDQ